MILKYIVKTIVLIKKKKNSLQDFVPIFERYIALVQNLYFLLNLVRHSCSGNTIYTVHKNNVLVLRAAKDIYPGELVMNF